MIIKIINKLEQLVLKEKSPDLFKDSVFLKDFRENKLKIARPDCVDKVIYHVDYAKEPTKKLILCT